MKKILSVISLFCTLALMAPVAQSAPIPNVWGVIYQNATTPGDGYQAIAPLKKGSATCKSILFLVGVGDCSVRQAMKNGGISQLSFYDITRENILGVVSITTNAYGK